MIGDNILEIRSRIVSSCSKVNRLPQEITIVAVSKGHSSEQIKEVIAAGIADIGENRIQEAILKYRELTDQRTSGPPIKWHMVGHLQTNKVKEAVKIFDLIQSVDTLHLAQEIDKQAAKINKIQDILIEVKTSPEASKFGLKPAEAIDVIKEIAQLKNIKIIGLMTIAPLLDNPEETRPYFRILRELRDKIYKFGIWDLSRTDISNLAGSRPAGEFGILSMGMTDDFEVAVEEGSTMIRLGRAIFEG